MHPVLMSYAIGTLLTAATADGVGLIDEPAFWGAEPVRVTMPEADVEVPPTVVDPELPAEWNACPGAGCPPKILVRECRADRATGWNIEGERPDAFMRDRGQVETVTVECGPALSPRLGVDIGTVSIDGRGARLSNRPVHGHPVEMRAKVGRRRIILEWRF